MKKTILMLLCLFASMGGVMADNYLPGTWNGEFSSKTDSRYQFVDNTLQLHLSVGTYEFKVYDNGYGNDKWLGNNGTMSMGNCTGWTFEEGKNNCGFYAPIEGDYTFTISWVGSTPTISATYPTPAGQRLENGENVVYINGTYSDDEYTLAIVASKPMNGLGGSYWSPSTGNARVDANNEKVSDFSYKFTAASNNGPQLYTPLYVMMPGEVNFGQPTINWTEDLGTGADSDLALTSNTSLNFDLADTEHLTSQIAYTTSSTGAVTYKSGNNAIATVSESGLITAVGVGSTTITVNQESDATYKKGKAVINVVIANTNFGPAVAPTAPTAEAEKVLAVYTDRYDLAINPTYKTDNWGSTPMTEERLIDTDHVRIYQMNGGVIVWGENNGGDNAIRGLEDNRYESYTGLNAAQMEYLHVDIWCDHVRNFTSIINDNGRGAQGETTANAWKSYDVPLAGINHGETGVENVRWLKFDGFAAGDVVAIANVYFYTTQDLNQASVLTTFSASASSQLTKVGEDNTINLDVKDQLSRPINDATVTYTVSPADAGNFVDNVYTPAKAGWATITAHASYDGVNLDAAPFQVLAHAGDNVVKSNSLPESKVIAQVAEEPVGAADAFFAIDGNDGSIWEIAEPAGTENHMFDAWFVVDLGANYDLELATVHFEGASSKDYDIEVAPTYNGDATVWTKVVEGATTPGMQNITNIHENLSSAKNVRYVRYFSHQAATGYGHKIYEFQVFGTEAVAPTTETITIGQYGYATYVAPCDLDFSEADVTAYAVTPDLENNMVTLTSVTEVPAGKAVVVKGNQGTHEVNITTDATDFVTALEVSATATAYDNEYTYYYLGQVEGVVGFRPLAENGSIAAGKCFFKVAKTPGAKFLTMSFDDEVSGISNVTTNVENNAVYNLAGQRVNANAKGIVIVNGKKYFNK